MARHPRVRVRRQAPSYQRRRGFGITEVLVPAAIGAIGDIGASIGGALGIGAADVGAAAGAADLGAAAGAADASGLVAGDFGALGAAGAAGDVGAGAAAAGATDLSALLGTTGTDILPTAATGTAAAGTDVASAAAAPLGSTIAGSGGLGASSVAAPAAVAGAGLDPTAAAGGIGADVAAGGGFEPASGALAGTAGTGAAGATGTAATGGAAAGTAGAAGAGGTAASGGIGGLVSGIQPYAQLAAPLIAGGGLAYNIINQNKENAQQAELVQQAEAQQAQAQTLESYLSSGTLPPGLQGGVTQALQAQQAAIIQGYASKGMSTNPAQNTALAADLASANQQAITLSYTLEQQLYNLGAQGMQLSSQDLQYLSGLAEQQTTATGNAIANFASALNASFGKLGGGKGTTITVS
jgi:hypothetical protein